MLSLDFIKNPEKAQNLLEKAEEVIQGSTTRHGKHSVNDTFIMFHPENNDHHFFAHADKGALLIKDLLYVSDEYIAKLPEIYDAVLLKKIVNFTQDLTSSSDEGELLKTLQQPETEKLLFLINASGILSLHVQEEKNQYSEDIAKAVTQKNILSMVEIGYKPQRARLLLGNTSPYQKELYSEEFNVMDKTAKRLLDATKWGGAPEVLLKIPNVDSSHYSVEEFIPTPDFSNNHFRKNDYFLRDLEKAFFLDPLKTTLSALQICDVDLTQGNRSLEHLILNILEKRSDNLLETQLNKFLPAREDLKNQFWEKYLYAQCLLPQKEK